MRCLLRLLQIFLKSCGIVVQAFALLPGFCFSKPRHTLGEALLLCCGKLCRTLDLLQSLHPFVRRKKIFSQQPLIQLLQIRPAKLDFLPDPLKKLQHLYQRAKMPVRFLSEQVSRKPPAKRKKSRTHNTKDHRINFTCYQLELFMDGDMEEMIDALMLADETARLAQSLE